MARLAVPGRRPENGPRLKAAWRPQKLDRIPYRHLGPLYGLGAWAALRAKSTARFLHCFSELPAKICSNCGTKNGAQISGRDLGPKNGPRSRPEKRAKVLARKTVQGLGPKDGPMPKLAYGPAPWRAHQEQSKRVPPHHVSAARWAPAVRSQRARPRPFHPVTPHYHFHTRPLRLASCTAHQALHKGTARPRPRTTTPPLVNKVVQRRDALHVENLAMYLHSAAPLHPPPMGAYTTAHRAIAAIVQRCSEATLVKHSRARGVPVPEHNAAK